jgi:hypothetical protein
MSETIGTSEESAEIEAGTTPETPPDANISRVRYNTRRVFGDVFAEQTIELEEKSGLDKQNMDLRKQKPNRSPKGVKFVQQELLNSPGLAEIRPVLKDMIKKGVKFVNGELVGGTNISPPVSIEELCNELTLFFPVNFNSVAIALFQTFNWQKVPFGIIGQITALLEVVEKRREKRGLFLESNDTYEEDAFEFKQIALRLKNLASPPKPEMSLISSSAAGGIVETSHR